LFETILQMMAMHSISSLYKAKMRN